METQYEMTWSNVWFAAESVELGEATFEEASALIQARLVEQLGRELTAQEIEFASNAADIRLDQLHSA